MPEFVAVNPDGSFASPKVRARLAADYGGASGGGGVSEDPAEPGTYFPGVSADGDVAAVDLVSKAGFPGLYTSADGAVDFPAVGNDGSFASPLVRGRLDATYLGRDYDTMRFDQFPVELPTGLVINTTAIASHVTTSPAGDTYAVFYGSDRNAYVAKMRYGRYTWSVTNLGLLPGIPLGIMPDDGHNYLTVAVDGEGYIHVAGNAHAHALQYARSVNPNDITEWVAGDLPNPENKGQTYPKFVNLGNGDLLLFNRQGGGATDGEGRDEVLSRYNRATKTWARVTTVLKGTPPVSPAEGPYVNRIVRNPTTGRIHLFYMWRMGYLSPTDNHDLGYLYSDNDGVTWRILNGTIQASPVTPANTAPYFVTGYLGAINQTGATVDSAGRPHSVWRLGNEVWHYTPSGSSWVGQSVSPGPASLPVVYATNDGRVYALWTDGSTLKARKVAPALEPEFTVLPGWSLPYYNVTFDGTGEQTNTLRILLAPSTPPEIDGGAYGGVLSIDMSPAGTAKVAARTVEPRDRPVAPPPTRRPIIAAGRNVYPMRAGLFYAPGGGVRQATTLVPNGQFRGYPFTAARASSVTAAGFTVFTAGSAGAKARVIVYGLSDGAVRGYSALVDVTTTGYKEVTFEDLWIGAGEAVVAGICCVQATGSGPAFTAVNGDNHDPLIGTPTGAAIMSAARGGWTVDGILSPPQNLAIGWTVNATSIGNPPVVTVQAGNITTSPNQ